MFPLVFDIIAHALLRHSLSIFRYPAVTEKEERLSIPLQTMVPRSRYFVPRLPTSRGVGPIHRKPTISFVKGLIFSVGHVRFPHSFPAAGSGYL